MHCYTVSNSMSYVDYDGLWVDRPIFHLVTLVLKFNFNIQQISKATVKDMPVLPLRLYLAIDRKMIKCRTP